MEPTDASGRSDGEQRVVGLGRHRNRTCARTAPATPRETDALETFSANCFMSARAAVLTEDLSRDGENEVVTSVTANETNDVMISATIYR